MYKIAAASVLIFMLAGSVLVHADPVSLRYMPALNTHQESVVSGKLTDIQLNGAPLPVSGSAEGVVKLDVVQTDPDTGNFTLRVSVEIKQAEFAGQAREVRSMPPSEMTLTPRGEVVKATGEAASGEKTTDLTGILAGDIPLNLVALVANSVSFPEQPVSVGDKWTVEEEKELPLLGKATLKTETTLVKVEDGKALLETSFSSDLPHTEMDNPWFAGKLTIESGKVSAERIQREFDLKRSLVVSAKGSIKADIVADLGMGMPMPASLAVDFEMRPSEEAEATAGSAAAPPGTAGASSEGTLAPQAMPDQRIEGGESADPATECTSSRRLTLGPVDLSAGYDGQAVRVRTEVDLSRAPLPSSLGRYRPLVEATRLGGEIMAGVAGDEAGKLGVGGEAQVGPMTARRSLQLDLKAMALRLVAAVRGLVGQH